jgi:hypothetical protein
MTAGHDEWHILAGAFILGGLSDQEHRVFAAHLRECRACQREVGELGGIPRLLDLADEPAERAPADAATASDTERPVTPAAPAIPDGGDPALVDLVARLRVGRRRARLRAGVAAAASAVVLAGGGIWLGLTLGRSGAATAATPTAQVAVAPAAGGSVSGQVAFVAKGWGTELRLDGAQLPTSGDLALWVHDGSGRADQVATWHGTPSGRTTLTAASARQLADIRTVEIRTSAGEVIAVARL